MFIWDCTWGMRHAEVTANTATGARKAARKAWGKTLRCPKDHEIEVFIRRHNDGMPVKPEPSGADTVVARIRNTPTTPRQQENW